jgi:hypothetical protein
MPQTIRSSSIAFLAGTIALGAGLSVAAATTTQSRDVTGFTSVALSAPIRVEVLLGEREGVVLEGDEDALARIETRVENGQLRIGTTSSFHLHSVKVRARVTARNIEGLSIAGSGDIHAPQLHGGAVKISVSGSGDVVVDGGKVDDVGVSLAGSGDIRIGKLEAQRVKVSISGSGDVTVWARQSLAVSVAGSGDVRFYGDPAVEKRVMGSGEVRRLGPSPS